MSGLAGFLKWLPLIDALVSLAEGLFGAKKGQDKKAFVTGQLSTVIDAAAGVYTANSGNALPMAELKPVLSHLIDASASMLFPHEDEVKLTEQF